MGPRSGGKFSIIKLMNNKFKSNIDGKLETIDYKLEIV